MFPGLMLTLPPVVPELRGVDSPGRAAAGEPARRAGGRAHLVRAVSTVVLVVAQPLGGDAAAPGTGEL